MDEPKRLLLDPGTAGFERDLLGAWSDEQPSADARDRARALATVAGAAAIAVVGGSIAPKAAATGLAAILKWLMIGAVVIGITAGGVGYSMREPEHAPPERVAPPSTPAPATPVVAPSAVATAASALPDAPPAAPVATPRAAHDVLAEQIAAMDAVRAALASGNGARALRLVDDYQRRFPRGAFGEEAEALRVDALAKSGDAAGATRAGQRFLSAHPGSPHAARVRAVVKSLTP
jgi:hypothetical protein